jgi:RimJ/RimL family protein N-acetyltransferase
MFLKTARLILTEFKISDAPFFYELLNDPAFIEFIGDRNIKSVSDAEKYLSERIIPSYAKNGFGFYLVSTNENNVPIGMSGIIDREGLDHIDVGFAFLSKFRGKGYAFEATDAVMKYATDTLKINPIVAITSTNNVKSINLLERLGLHYDKLIQLPNETEKIKLFST